jgi:hypothetical protein
MAADHICAAHKQIEVRASFSHATFPFLANWRHCSASLRKRSASLSPNSHARFNISFLVLNTQGVADPTAKPIFANKRYLLGTGSGTRTDPIPT